MNHEGFVCPLIRLKEAAKQMFVHHIVDQFLCKKLSFQVAVFKVQSIFFWVVKNVWKNHHVKNLCFVNFMQLLTKNETFKSLVDDNDVNK